MRTRKTIDRDIKVGINDLNLLVEESVKSEQDFESRQQNFEKHIEVLKKEKSYEETLAGQIDEFVVDTRKAIQIMLNRLAQTTGVELKFQLITEFEIPSGSKARKHLFAFPHQKDAFKAETANVLMNSHTVKEKIDKILDLMDEML